MDNIIQFWDEDQKKYVEVSEDNPLPISLASDLANIDPIPDPSSATAEDVAIAFNALLTALKS